MCSILGHVYEPRFSEKKPWKGDGNIWKRWWWKTASPSFWECFFLNFCWMWTRRATIEWKKRLKRGGAVRLQWDRNEMDFANLTRLVGGWKSEHGEIGEKDQKLVTGGNRRESRYRDEMELSKIGFKFELKIQNYSNLRWMKCNLWKEKNTKNRQN